MDVVKNTSCNNLSGTAELLKIAKSKLGRDERTTVLFRTGGQKSDSKKKTPNKYC